MSGWTGYIVAAGAAVVAVGAVGLGICRDCGSCNAEGASARLAAFQPETQDQQAPAQPDMDAMEEAWRQAGTPDEHHEKIARLEGEWDAAATFWMAPDEPPSESTGSAVNKMIMGGRYLQCDYTGDWEEQQFRGRGHLGYDKAGGFYVQTWFDDMSTGIMHETGKADADGDTITFTGEHYWPGQVKVKHRSVLEIVSDDKYVYTMYRDAGDGEVKGGEIVYTRK